jgi:hypothetical protein|tara:strand:+ start:397 stop:621 length:225 start_codon:yes stop_codon:yes gene_type:complete
MMMFEDKNEQFRGAGDVVEWIAERSGIKYLVKRVYGINDCGCSERQQKLNKMIPFDPKINFTESRTKINNEKNI